MFLVGNRSVKTILINECVNGCSLLEDNSRRLLDASTMTHGAHTKMHARRLHGEGGCELICLQAAPRSTPRAHKRDTQWLRVTCRERAPNLQGLGKTLRVQAVGGHA